MSMDQDDLYFFNALSSQSSLQIRRIAHQNTNDFPHKNGKKENPKTHVKPTIQRIQTTP